MKVLVAMGTRPEAIKMAPVIRALLQAPDAFQTVTCFTAQHRGLLDQVIQAFDLPVDHDLNLMSSGQSLFDVSARALLGLKEVYE